MQRMRCDVNNYVLSIEDAQHTNTLNEIGLFQCSYTVARRGYCGNENEKYYFLNQRIHNTHVVYEHESIYDNVKVFVYE